MKKELLIASALVSTMGVASVAQAVTATMSGHHDAGLQGADTDAGADSIRNHTKTIKENAGMAAKNAAIQRGSFSNSFKIVASAADDLKLRLTDVLDPLIRGANERAIQALNFLSNFVRTKGPEIRDFLVGAFNVAKEKVLEALTLTVGYVSVSAEQISNKLKQP